MVMCIEIKMKETSALGEKLQHRGIYASKGLVYNKVIYCTET